MASGLYDNVSAKQVRSDLKYLQEKYGSCYDFCGGFCNCDVLKDLMFGKITPKEACIDNIRAYFDEGADRERCAAPVYPDRSDTRIARMVERYYID